MLIARFPSLRLPLLVVMLGLLLDAHATGCANGTSADACIEGEAGIDKLPSQGPAGTYCQYSPANAPSLIMFPGWTVTPADGWVWLQQLRKAAWPGQQMASLCVSKGPADARFINKDIATDGLAKQLIAKLGGDSPVIVIAHSSGTFVAHDLFQKLYARGGKGLLQQVRYYNLDGDIGSRDTALTAPVVNLLASLKAVYAYDETIATESSNADAMRKLQAQWPAKAVLQKLRVTDSGCHSGARWCVHDALINRKPYNPASFDLVRDYGQIDSSHPVQAGYLP